MHNFFIRCVKIELIKESKGAVKKFVLSLRREKALKESIPYEKDRYSLSSLKQPTSNKTKKIVVS